MSDPAPGGQPIDSLGGCLLVLFWLLLGNLILFGCAMGILRQPPWDFSLLDATYWVVLALTVAARRLDWAKREKAVPERRGAMQRWTIAMVAIAAGVWALAHAVQMLA